MNQGQFSFQNAKSCYLILPSLAKLSWAWAGVDGLISNTVYTAAFLAPQKMNRLRPLAVSREGRHCHLQVVKSGT